MERDTDNAPDIRFEHVGVDDVASPFHCGIEYLDDFLRRQSDEVLSPTPRLLILSSPRGSFLYANLPRSILRFLASGSLFGARLGHDARRDSHRAMSLRAEKTLPCMPGGTFACKIAWLEAFARGPKTAAAIMIAIQAAAVWTAAKARRSEPVLSRIMGGKTD